MIFLLYIASLAGCLDVYKPPAVKEQRVKIQPAVATISCQVIGDSITSVLWTCDSTNVDILNPDSLVSEVHLYKRGVYSFTIYIQNVWGEIDSATQKVTVN